MKKEYAVGYTQGVYDMFHIGHLNLLNQAKQHCDYLIVGVNSNRLVEEYKKKTPVIDQKYRKAIVENIKAVDRCIIVDTLDKKKIWESLHFDVIFIGDDWYGNARWAKTGEEMAELGVKLVYLKHTSGVSSTLLRDRKDEEVSE